MDGSPPPYLPEPDADVVDRPLDFPPPQIDPLVVLRSALPGPPSAPAPSKIGIRVVLVIATAVLVLIWVGFAILFAPATLAVFADPSLEGFAATFIAVGMVFAGIGVAVMHVVALVHFW